MFTDAPAEEILESHHESQKLLEQEATEKANKKAAMAPARDMASQLVRNMSSLVRSMLGIRLL